MLAYQATGLISCYNLHAKEQRGGFPLLPIAIGTLTRDYKAYFGKLSQAKDFHYNPSRDVIASDSEAISANMGLLRYTTFRSQRRGGK